MLRYNAALVFTALCLWREARGETDDVIKGVANVIMNRARKQFTNLISVVTKPWQFSSLTDPKDRQLTTWPKENDPSWLKCLTLANDLIEGTLANPVGGADHYYDISMKTPPAWADENKFVAKLGRIRFFNLIKDVS